MIIRQSWRMREEGEMVVLMGECPYCQSPASGVVSSQLLQFPLRNLPEVFCPKCRKRVPASANHLRVLPVSARRCS